MESVLSWNTLRSPGSFGSVRNLQRYSGRSEREVKKFLRSQDAYTLHKPRRVHFPRRKTYSKGIGDLFQTDLVDLSSLSSFNDCRGCDLRDVTVLSVVINYNVPRGRSKRD